MRFAWVMAATAVLWVQPARAVDIKNGVYSGLITSGTADLQNAGLQSIQLADLTGLSILFTISTTTDSSIARAIASFSIPNAPNPLMTGYDVNTFNVYNETVSIVGTDARILAALPNGNNNTLELDLTGPVVNGQLSSLAGTIRGNQWGFGPDYGRVRYDFTVNLTGFGIVERGVPEPATWLLMILGIGITGVAMRRHVSPRTSQKLASR